MLGADHADASRNHVSSHNLAQTSNIVGPICIDQLGHRFRCHMNVITIKTFQEVPNEYRDVHSARAEWRYLDHNVTKSRWDVWAFLLNFRPVTVRCCDYLHVALSWFVCSHRQKLTCVENL